MALIAFIMTRRVRMGDNGKPLEEVDYFKYIASVADGGCETDVGQ